MSHLSRRPKATFQVDLDGSWVLLQWLGCPPSENTARRGADALFDQGIPRTLELFERYGVRATYFVNGLDLEDAGKRARLEEVAAAGHEIASHGWDHGYFSMIDAQERTRQIADSAAAIRDVFGAAPRGFRAAGYDMDAAGLQILEAHGYTYDCSALPTAIGPALELSQRLLTGRRQVSYPLLQQLSGPTEPYQPHSTALYRPGGSGIVEIPVSVVPALRLPLSFSYSALMGDWYLRAGLGWALKSAGTVNFLFHLIDFVGPVEHPRLSKLPLASMPIERRLRLAAWAVREVCDRADVLRTDDLLASLSGAAPAALPSLALAGGSR